MDDLKVLMVDDEPNILEGYARELYGEVRLKTAASGAEGLEILNSSGPFAVVISDYKMPQMNGAKFLSEVEHNNPNIVRIMLTGYADVEIAIDAVNRGHIYRLLTKPCSAENLLAAIRDGLKQYQLVTAERELLEKTLLGSIRVLTDVLSLANPTAFSHVTRLKKYVGSIAKELGLASIWEFELAATFSLLGCITLPATLLEKIYTGTTLDDSEREMYLEHPNIGSDLIKKIPRLENIAAMISAQNKKFHRSAKNSDLKKENRIALGGIILKSAQIFDQLLGLNLPTPDLLQQVEFKLGHNVPEIQKAIQNLEAKTERKVMTSVSIDALNRTMVLAQDVRATNGLLLVPEGQEVTFPVIARLRNHAKGIGVIQPIQVTTKSGPSAKKSLT